MLGTLFTGGELRVFTRSAVQSLREVLSWLHHVRLAMQSAGNSREQVRAIAASRTLTANSVFFVLRDAAAEAIHRLVEIGLKAKKP